ncbi:MAG: DNA polymerase III subunit gamma/tau [Clostridiales bacterium]|nr:DNA polymerase III subunit gamma/tau [Candidatus Equinaster intestinalis]
MSYKALYRKYRPLTFSDVVGQDHITKTLRQELSSGKIFHAYLFTGTRGTGKTTCAKILAKAVNCEHLKDGDPCGECEACRAINDGEVMDIVEIDAASNNSVDNIRELREQVNFTPANAKYRVYIIDEVHMLTISAFNALLKTLEEPPAHVIFILATTEVHKLPSTILSRCQRFDFKRIDPEIISSRLKFVADKEGFTITDDAADMIAAIADGGMRDALSTLDLCVSASNDITAEIVAKTCGMASNEYLVKMADCILSLDTEGALLLCDEIYNSSVDMLRLLEDLILHFRNLMIIKTVRSEIKPIVCSPDHLKELTRQANSADIKTVMLDLRILQDATAGMQTGNRRTEMELTLIKLCSPKLRADTESLEQRIALLETAIKSGSYSKEIPTAKTGDKKEKIAENITPAETDIIEEIPIPEQEYAPPAPQQIEPEPDTEAVNDSSNEMAEVDNETWQSILGELAKSAPLLRGILNDSKAYIDGEFLLVDSSNHQFPELMNSSNGQYRERLRRAVETVLGKTYKLGPYRKKAAKSDDPLDALREKLKALEVPKA